MNYGDAILFSFHGFLGGVLWLFVKWRWRKKEVAQHTIVSAIAGYIYYLLHSEYNFPNSVIAVVVGYFSVDFVRNIFEKFKSLF